VAPPKLLVPPEHILLATDGLGVPNSVANGMSASKTPTDQQDSVWFWLLAKCGCNSRGQVQIRTVWTKWQTMC